MLLMDMVTLAAHRAREADIANDPTLRLYCRLAEKLNPAHGPIPPRYVLDKNATMIATELSLGRPKVLNDIVHRTIVPYSQMWVEWEDSARKILRERFRQHEMLDIIRPYPARMGFFIETDPKNLRRGKVTWAWSAKDNAVDLPNVSPVTAHFDLDADLGLDPQLRQHPLTIAEPWRDNPEQYTALHKIWHTVRHHFEEQAYPFALTQFDRDLIYADVVGEYLMVFLVLLLLTSARKAVELRPVDLSRLNKARAKAKKTALLNHHIVHLYYGDRNQKSTPVMARGPLGYSRKSPRVHLVSSYPAVRAGKPTIVMGHPRGYGSSGVSRTTHVHG